MNEIQKIHIHRQAYTIAVDAHGELKKYLDALKQRIDDKEVYTEIELRVVELLAERGVSGEKVILLDDVDFLRENLGQVSDFDGEEPEQIASLADDGELPKRFMRNPRGQMIGGVSNGLAAYFGLDPVWFRLAFIGLTFASGFGILLYLVLWVIMPEAKTSSDFIRMQGKPVTVDSITEFAESKEVEAGIHRVGVFVSDAFKLGVRVLLFTIAIALITLGIIGVAASIGGTIMLLAHGQALFDGVRVFPVSGVEIASVIIGAVAGAAGSFFMVFSGSSIIAQKWQLPGWATAGMLTIFFAGVFTAIPLAASSLSAAASRVDNAYIKSTKPLQPFTKLDITGQREVNISFEVAEEHSIETTVFGEKDASLITAVVTDDTLKIDTDAFMQKYRCESLCLYDTSPSIVVRGPVVRQLKTNGSVHVGLSGKMAQDSLELIRAGSGTISVGSVYPERVTYINDESRVLLEGLRTSTLESDRLVMSGFGGGVMVGRVDELHLLGGLDERGCIAGDPLVTTGQRPRSVLVNEEAVDASLLKFDDETIYGNDSQRTLSNCIMVSGS